MNTHTIGPELVNWRLEDLASELRTYAFALAIARSIVNKTLREYTHACNCPIKWFCEATAYLDFRGRHHKNHHQANVAYHIAMMHSKHCYGNICCILR